MQVNQGLSSSVLATPSMTVFEEFLRQAGSANLPPDIDENEVFSALLAGLGEPSPDRPTPLALACVAGRPEWVMELIEKGGDPNQIGEGHTPITALACQGITYPIRMGDLSKQPERGWDQIDRSIAQSRCVEILVAAGANLNAPSAEGASPLILACLAKNTHLATFLLGLGANPHPPEFGGQGVFSLPPLYVSIVSHCETLFGMLVDVGADPFLPQHAGKDRRMNLIDATAAWGLPGMLDHLSGILGPNHEAIKSAWWVALETGNRQTIDWYLRKKADPRAPDANGSHPSHILARSGHYDLLSDFFRRGLPLDIPDAQGNTALEVLAVHHPDLYRQVRQHWRGLPGNILLGKFPGPRQESA